mmetsp:Transcript_18460/g.8608  ORF Transcript_18460/g.8608 Transcript_18460/m.8608 type:complete len:124 (-) Transcript_18460:989-1360(-)
MGSIKQTQKKYCSKALITAIIIGFTLILIGFRAEGKGLVLGTIFSSVNFVLIGKLIPLQIGKSKRKNFLLSFVSIVFRYFILAIPLILAIKLEHFDMFYVVIGVFMVQIIILTEHLIRYIKRA